MPLAKVIDFPTGTALNPQVIDHLVTSARTALRNHDSHFSMKYALLDARKYLRVSVNNNLQIAYREALIARVPAIEPLIETRSVPRGRNKPTSVTLLDAVLAAAAKRGAVIREIKVELPDGRIVDVSITPAANKSAR